MIRYPEAAQEQALLTLWREIFGEYDGFWEIFLRTGFSHQRCRCLMLDGDIAAALCWLDCSVANRKYAYVYAVMTHPRYRHRGLCRRLMEDTHALLTDLGYAGVLLVPAEESLRQMYGAMGYRNATKVREFSCNEGLSPVSVRPVSPPEYALLRRKLLPPLGVVQEGENLSFLSAQAELFAGEDFLMAAYREGEILRGMELLGNTDAAPGILKALGFPHGTFRCPGEEKDFAMFLPLEEDTPIPNYFGFAFD